MLLCGIIGVFTIPVLLDTWEGLHVFLCWLYCPKLVFSLFQDEYRGLSHVVCSTCVLLIHLGLGDPSTPYWFLNLKEGYTPYVTPYC